MLRKKNVLTLGEKMHFEKARVDLHSKEQGSFPFILQSEAEFLLSDCGCAADLCFTLQFPSLCSFPREICVTPTQTELVKGLLFPRRLPDKRDSIRVLMELLSHIT